MWWVSQGLDPGEAKAQTEVNGLLQEDMIH